MTNRLIVLVTSNHPLYSLLIKSQLEVHEIPGLHLPDLHLDENTIIADFCLLPLKRKKELFKKYHVPFVSDLGPYVSSAFFAEFDHLWAAHSLSFSGENKKCEAMARGPEPLKIMSNFLKQWGVDVIEQSVGEPSFFFPRVLSMMINEAYFARDEKVANEQDIDLAMRFGVNYPQGPFAWAKKIGEKNICQLLDHWYELTKEPRYRPALGLKLQGVRS